MLQEDRDDDGKWRVEYQDDDGACYVTIFAGPEAARRARDYFEALKMHMRLRSARPALIIPGPSA